jgi:hypothetical protein
MAVGLASEYLGEMLDVRFVAMSRSDLPDRVRDGGYGGPPGGTGKLVSPYSIRLAITLRCS